MNVNKVSKIISVVAIIVAGLAGTISALMIFGGTADLTNIPNTICCSGLLVWALAFVVMRFSKPTS